ncbi:MAG: putative rane protein YoaK, family [Herbaspirillum sp.]|nr:putative rane protein YoaK, family [Herbaspirillum sp.]
MNANHRNQLQGISLGCVAGYVDTLGFIALFGLFTAHVTGNFVLIGAELADPSHVPILLKFLAFPAFVLGVAAARLLIAASQSRDWSGLTLSLTLQMLLLCGFMACGWLASPIGSDATPLAMAAGLLGAAAMGAHSATSRLLLSHLAPTSMMTGNVTQIVIDTVDVLRGAADKAVGERCMKFTWPLVAFGGGAILAAFIYLAIGFSALLFPIAILCCMIVMQWNLDRIQVGVAQ